MAVLIVAPPFPAAVGMGVSPALPGPEQTSLIFEHLFRPLRQLGVFPQLPS